VGAIPEIVRENVTGLLAPAGNVPALAAVLHRLIDDPVLRARLGGEAARLAARNYNAETNAVRLLELLKNIARRPASVE
jgi:glycosyltransferase involved in cell wall biosynthesis